jgi:haloalkane dehalogenase
MTSQRDWYWRGWRIHYLFQQPENLDNCSETAIVLVHGFGANVGHWRHNISTLAQHHWVYAVDLLGFGSSSKVFTQYQITLWQEQLYDFCQNFIRSPIVLIGNSLGSLVSLSVAAKHPSIVYGVIVLNVPDVGNRSKQIPSFIFPVLRILENLVANSLLLRPLFYFVRRSSTIKSITKLAYFDQSNVDDELVEMFAKAAQEPGSDKAFLALVRYAGGSNFAPPVTQLLKKITSPILFIWGKEDRIVPFNQAIRLLESMPQIRLIALEKMGHCPHDESPSLLNSIFLEWLAENGL